MRYKYQGFTKDQNGRVIQGATISVYLAGTTTTASVYAASSGGTAANSVLSDDNGYFSFWVDTDDYGPTQKFKTVTSKPVSSVASYASVTVDDIIIMQTGTGILAEYDALDYGTAKTSATINAAITSIGASTAATLLLRPGTWAISSDLTILPNITLKIVPGATIQVATGKTVTINGPLQGSDGCFTCVGTGKVKILSGVRTPNMWKINASPGTTDMSDAIQASLDSGISTAFGGENGGFATIYFPDAAYKTTKTIDLSNRSYMRLYSDGLTQITSTTTDYIVDATGLQHSDMENLYFYSATARVGIYRNRSTTITYARENRLKHVQIRVETGTSANGGIGTIGYYNCRAEEDMVMDGSDIRGDVAVKYSSIPVAGLAPVATGVTEQAVGTGYDSLEGISFANSVITSLSLAKKAMQLYGVNTGEFVNNTMQSESATGSETYFAQLDSCVKLKITGVMEGNYPQFAKINTTSQFLDINLLLVAANMTVNGVISIPSGQGLYDSNVIVSMGGSSPSVIVPIMKAAAAGALIKGNRVVCDVTNVRPILPSAGDSERVNGNISNNYEQTTGAIVINNKQIDTTGEHLLSTTTISLAADGDTTLYTVPASNTCVLTRAILVVGANASTTTLSIGASGSTTDFIPANTLSNLSSANTAGILQPIPNTTPLAIRNYAGSVTIKATVGSHAGGATNTIYLYGMLY